MDDKKSILIFGVTGQPRMVRGYEFFTANDNPTRDPVQWELFGGQSAGGPWQGGYRYSRVQMGSLGQRGLGM
jgi:hypothetical protein